MWGFIKRTASAVKKIVNKSVKVIHAILECVALPLTVIELCLHFGVSFSVALIVGGLSCGFLVAVNILHFIHAGKSTEADKMIKDEIICNKQKQEASIKDLQSDIKKLSADLLRLEHENTTLGRVVSATRRQTGEGVHDTQTLLRDAIQSPTNVGQGGVAAANLKQRKKAA